MRTTRIDTLNTYLKNTQAVLAVPSQPFLLQLDNILIPANYFSNMTNITPAQLRKAADLQEKIQSLQSELNSILGGGEVSTPAETATTEKPKKRKFSAASRAKMRASQRARWADKEETTPGEPEPAAKQKQKRKMSAEGLANIQAGVARREAARAKAAKQSQF